MFFVEPPSVYAIRRRIFDPQRVLPAATQSTVQKRKGLNRLPDDDFWTELVFNTIQTSENIPIRITGLVNQVVTKGGFANNRERVERKIKLFKLVGRLIRIGRLDRCDRKFVVIPTSDAKHQAFLAKAATTVELPPPSV